MLAYIDFLAVLVLNMLVSWGRMFVALAVSILISLLVGIYIARHSLAERFAIPIIDILQTLPILTFFPIVILVFVTGLPGFIGINAAIIFLIVTSMLWNIILAVYEAVKLLPTEYVEVAKLNKMSNWQMITGIYIPASLPGIVQQSMLSWAIGLFYLVTSEIFSTGASFCSAGACQAKYGIGVLLTTLAFSGHILEYVIGIALFIVFVAATMLLFFVPLEKRVNKEKTTSSNNNLVDRLLKRLYVFKGFAARSSASSATPYRHAEEQRQKQAMGHAPTKLSKSQRNAIILMVVLLIATAMYALLYHFHALNTVATYEYLALLNLGSSFLRVWITFALILVVAVPVSIYLIFIAKHETRYILLFQIIASIPATILLPLLALALVGVRSNGEILAFIIFFISGIWYVIFGILAGTKSISSEIPEVKKIYGVKGKQAWKSIYLKAIIPGLITGGITAVAAEWNASIVAEYFTSSGITGTPNCAPTAINLTTTAATNCTRIVSSVGYGIGKLLDTSVASNNNLLLAIALINMTAMIVIINTVVWKKLYTKTEQMR